MPLTNIASALEGLSKRDEWNYPRRRGNMQVYVALSSAPPPRESNRGLCNIFPSRPFVPELVVLSCVGVTMPVFSHSRRGRTMKTR